VMQIDHDMSFLKKYGIPWSRGTYSEHIYDNPHNR